MTSYNMLATWQVLENIGFKILELAEYSTNKFLCWLSICHFIMSIHNAFSSFWISNEWLLILRELAVYLFFFIRCDLHPAGTTRWICSSLTHWTNSVVLAALSMQEPLMILILQLRPNPRSRSHQVHILIPWKFVSFEHLRSHRYFFCNSHKSICFRYVTSRSGICWSVRAWFIIVVIAERSREDAVADGRLVVLLVPLWRIRGWKNCRQADAVDWWRKVRLECKQFIRLTTGEWKKY